MTTEITMSYGVLSDLLTVLAEWGQENPDAENVEIAIFPDECGYVAFITGIIPENEDAEE